MRLWRNLTVKKEIEIQKLEREEEERDKALLAPLLLPSSLRIPAFSAHALRISTQTHIQRIDFQLIELDPLRLWRRHSEDFLR
ncbi:unnamed protein product [Cuscuta campestris]|uniref:Uncharacterized protein n=1 Tax=Cuscuta campestris TaxID=132261 RepID=A0A484LLL5_9ASTE|nr:unnamed protein product [Cuscuta campestris]